MKKDIRYIFALLIGITFFGCSEDFLEKEPNGAPSNAVFWKTESDAIAAVNAIYANFGHLRQYGRGFYWYVNASDDMVTGRIKSDPDNIKNFYCTGNEGYTNNVWQLKYQVIKRCNDVLRNVPAMEIDNSLKNRILGEAHFVASVMYLELAYHYGDHRAGIPILDREDPSNYYIEREPNVASNYLFIADELKKAAELLPYFETYAAHDYGRAHKTAALGYLARTYIYLAQYDAQYWSEAEKVCDQIIASGKHALEEKYEDAFKIANNTGPEYMWSVVSSEREGSMFAVVAWENKGWGKINGWGYFQPTKELFDEYEEGDERRDWTIFKDGDVFQYFGEPFTWYQSSNNVTGYMFGKYREPFANANPIGNTIGSWPISTDLWLPLLRYAEIYLFKAEALAMQGKNCDDPINIIRARAGLPAKSNCTMEDVKHERRCELAGEWTDRHYDLVRWGDADENYAKPLHGSQGQEVWPARPHFDPSIHHVWPIPPHEIENSKGTLTQNEGW
ncbi:RagB/SusD family nutrient uptake outer membrane protein [Puteibacter caeruleilacunae]|nr:RagB/SusD family nutrient uptake outer membrane protein [Puteibacter caeruleilacunae]